MCVGTMWILVVGVAFQIQKPVQNAGWTMKVDSPWGPGETREGALGCSGVRSPGSAFFTGRWWASACGVLGEEHFGDIG